MLVNAVNNRFFGSAVSVANEIVVRLFLDLEFVEIGHFLYQGMAGTARRHHGHVEKWVHQTIPLMSKNSAMGRLRR
jgi:hypothetical protein